MMALTDEQRSAIAVALGLIGFSPDSRVKAAHKALKGMLVEAPGEDAEYMATVDVRDMFALLRGAWREGQHYDREDVPDQADSWSAATDYANKVIEDWTGIDASATAGMTLGERIAHVGGRENAAGYIEFGSVMAVDALIRHVLRDRAAPVPVASYAQAVGVEVPGSLEVMALTDEQRAALQWAIDRAQLAALGKVLDSAEAARWQALQSIAEDK